MLLNEIVMDDCLLRLYAFCRPHFCLHVHLLSRSMSVDHAFSFILFCFSVYETCKLGTHSPQSLGNHMEVDSRKLSSSGFVLLDCPQSMKIESNTSSLVGSISDYFLSLSSAWDLTKYLKSLSNALKSLSYSACLTSNAKEGINGPCMVGSFGNIVNLDLNVHDYL